MLRPTIREDAPETMKGAEEEEEEEAVEKTERPGLSHGTAAAISNTIAFEDY